MLRLLTKALDAAFAALVGLAVAAVVGELPAETVVVWMALAVGLFLVRSRRDTSHSLVSAGIKNKPFSTTHHLYLETSDVAPVRPA